MKVGCRGQRAQRSFSSTAWLRAWLLLVGSPLLLLLVDSAHAGEYFTYVSPKEPPKKDEEPRTCDESLSCSCPNGEGRSGAEIEGHDVGLWDMGSNNPGNTRPKGLGGDPVALFTGGFHHAVVDLELPGVIPIRFIRRYDSRSTYDSPLGFGWSFNYDMRLYRFPGNNVVVRSGCGDRNPYELLTNGVYQLADPERGSAPALVESPSGTFTLTYRSGERAIFGAGGLLESLEDPQGNRLEFEYLPELPLRGLPQDSPGPATVMTVAYVRPLSKVKEWTRLEGYTGREVTLEYDTATGRVKRLTALDTSEVPNLVLYEVLYKHQDTTLEPTYRGNLAKVTGLEGLIEEYRYEDASGDPHNLTAVRESQGVSPLANDYDAQDRVKEQRRGLMQWVISYGANGLRTVARKLLGDVNQPIYTTSFTFNTIGHLTQKVDALGNRFEYTRQSGSPHVDLVKVLNPGFPITLYRQADLDFDSAGNLTQRRIGLDSGEILTENWTYDHDWVASYQIVSSWDPGTVFRTDYTFYREGSLLTDRPTNVMEIKRQKATGVFETTLLTYDGNGQLETITPPPVTPADGLVIRRIYYGANDPGGGPGLLKSIQLWQGATADSHLSRAYTYDNSGRLKSTTDAKNHTTNFVFDSRGRLTNTTNALGEQSLFTYRGPNDITAEPGTPGPNLIRIEVGRTATDGDGRITRLRWNVHGDLLKVERKKNLTDYEDFATYTYDSEGKRKTAKDALDRVTTFGWDALRRLTSVTDASVTPRTTTFNYDAMGNRTKLTDALSRITDFVYDDADRLAEVRALGPNPDEITVFSYDAAGNVTQVTDPKSQATAYAYDPLSRLKSVTQPRGVATTGNSNDYIVRYEYDGRGRLDHLINARGETLRSFYFAWGGLERQVYDIDSDGAESGEREVSYAYDLEGHVTSASDNDPLLGISGPPYTLYSANPATGYDALGRLHQLTVHFPASGGPRTLTSTYNRFGERMQLDLTQGQETLSHAWTFDPMGRLDFATFPGSSTPLDFDPLKNDTLAKITRPSGTTTDYAYFPQGSIDTITVKAGGATQISRLAYTVDAVQNITNLSEQHATSDPTGAYGFGYDPANRLTSASYPAVYGFTGNDSFVYDPAGNREDPADPNQYAYDANNRLTASPGFPSYTFDDDGNLTARTGETYSYDATNRLRGFTNGSNTAVYAYDPFGRRIKKTVNGVTTWYLWDGDQLLAEYDGSGVRKVRYAYAGGFAPAQVAYKNGAGEDVYDVHSDHLDTPRLLTNSTGSVAWREAHEAFGKSHLDSGISGSFNVRFPGQYFDGESGLHDNRFRTYDPAVGRYISADPIGQGSGSNLFAYAMANPLVVADPLGLRTFHFGLGATVGAGVGASTSKSVSIDGSGDVSIVTSSNAGSYGGVDAQVTVTVGFTGASSNANLQGGSYAWGGSGGPGIVTLGTEGTGSLDGSYTGQDINFGFGVPDPIWVEMHGFVGVSNVDSIGSVFDLFDVGYALDFYRDRLFSKLACE